MELVLHIGDAEFEEGGALDHALGPRRILLARQLDDQAAAALDLDDGLGRPELVDARADHAFGALDRVGAVGHRTLALVHLEGEVDAPLQVEPQVHRDAADGGVLHLPGLLVDHALLDVARDQGPDTEQGENGDGDQTPTNRVH